AQALQQRALALQVRGAPGGCASRTVTGAGGLAVLDSRRRHGSSLPSNTALNARKNKALPPLAEGCAGARTAGQTYEIFMESTRLRSSCRHRLGEPFGGRSMHHLA